MPEVAIDVALELPPSLRARTLSASAVLAGRMDKAGHPSVFQLGQPLPGDIEPCHPHVTLFKLQIDLADVGRVLAAVAGVTALRPALAAAGDRWAYNRCGAPELYFRRSAAWISLQAAIVAAVEPIRQGRLRDTDPAGDRLDDLIDTLRRDDPEDSRLRQLLDFGFDEIGDRFNPHITVAWPVDNAFRVDFDGLPEPAGFDGVLSDVAVFDNQRNGTCGRRYGGFSLLVAA